MDPDDYFPENEFPHPEDSNSFGSFEIPLEYSQSESVFVGPTPEDSRELTRQVAPDSEACA